MDAPVASVSASSAAGVAPAPNHCFGARAVRARRLLERCGLCQRRCGANRLAGEAAPCRLGADTYVFNQYVSLTEEPEVIPALRVYLGGCNLRCRFCDTAPQCFEPAHGRKLESTSYAHELAAVVSHGVKTISVLGGEPTLHVHTLLEIAGAAPDPLPLAINTNLYMTPEVIELLDGAATLYLADFKFGSDACARRLAGVSNYVDVARTNLKLIAQRTPVAVRHLLMPGHLECCFRPVADWLSEEVPGTRVELYTGYVPCWQAGTCPELGRLNTRAETHTATDYLRTLNLRWRTNAGGISRLCG